MIGKSQRERGLSLTLTYHGYPRNFSVIQSPWCPQSLVRDTSSRHRCGMTCNLATIDSSANLRKGDKRARYLTGISLFFVESMRGQRTSYLSKLAFWRVIDS
jgi:hypothetical protein